MGSLIFLSDLDSAFTSPPLGGSVPHWRRWGVNAARRSRQGFKSQTNQAKDYTCVRLLACWPFWRLLQGKLKKSHQLARFKSMIHIPRSTTEPSECSPSPWCRLCRGHMLHGQHCNWNPNRSWRRMSSKISTGLADSLSRPDTPWVRPRSFELVCIQES